MLLTFIRYRHQKVYAKATQSLPSEVNWWIKKVGLGLYKACSRLTNWLVWHWKCLSDPHSSERRRLLPVTITFPLLTPRMAGDQCHYSVAQGPWKVARNIASSEFQTGVKYGRQVTV